MPPDALPNGAAVSPPPPHSSRPGGAARLLAARHVDPPIAPSFLDGFTQWAGGRSYNADPCYDIPARVDVRQRNNLTTAQTITVVAIEDGLPDLVEASDVVESFHEMLRSKSKDDLETWIDRAPISLVASFGNGVIRDRAAVQNAITSTWSNGQTEGQLSKFTLIKRQMYGRGKLDLLKARIMGAP